MLYQAIRIERSHGYYFEVCYLLGEYYVFVERSEEGLVVEKYFKNENDALSYFESVYFDCTGELLD